MTTLTSGAPAADHAGARDPVLDGLVGLAAPVVDGPPTPARTARSMREQEPDEIVFRGARCIVWKMAAASPIAIMRRAAVSVEGTLSLSGPERTAIDHVASCGWLGDGPCVHCDPHPSAA